MTLVTAVSSVSYRLIDIDKVRFLSIPVSMFQIMWVRTQFDLVGRIYQYGAQGLDVAKIEREIRQLVNEASVSLPPASERDRSVNFLRG